MTNYVTNQSFHGNYHIFNFKNKFYIFDRELFRTYEIKKNYILPS